MPQVLHRIQTSAVATPIDDATVAQLKLGDARIQQVLRLRDVT
jgi:hypothetical protein